MRLYHFLSEKYAKKALINKRLKVSIINELNDPFEFHAGFSSANRQIRKIFAKFKAVISREFGILCFSRNWSNPLLWSHYTERHTGFALGFDIPDNKTIEVKYSKERPLFKWDKIPDSRIRQDYLLKLIKTKFISWKYEEEFRLFYRLSDLKKENALYFQEFDDNLILKEVIAGCKSQTSDEDFLKLLEGYSDITAMKSRMAFKSYKIVRNKEKIWGK